MPQDPSFYLTISALALAAIVVMALAGLRGWREWIEFKRAELESQHRPSSEALPSAVSRIEVADLKERVKKLEAIAAGIDI
jgi:predicted negative regulator of RcsB-dependent stress response